jgi:hypothetical protein
MQNLKWAAMMLLAAGLVTGNVASYAADSHSDGHTSGHTSGSKGKGPKYMGGERGSSHSSQSHKGGTHHHDSSSGGSKAVEGKIFGGSGGHETHDEGTTHAH